MISIHARSWKQDWEERAHKNEGRTVFIRDEVGNVSEQPYNEGTAFINPYLDEIMDLTFKFERAFLQGTTIRRSPLPMALAVVFR